MSILEKPWCASSGKKTEGFMYDSELMNAIKRLTGSGELARDVLDIVTTAIIETLLTRGRVNVPLLGQLVLKTRVPKLESGDYSLLYLTLIPDGLHRSLTIGGLTPFRLFRNLLTEPMLLGFEKYLQEALSRLPKEHLKLIEQTKVIQDKCCEITGVEEYDPSVVTIEQLKELAKWCFENDLVEAFISTDRHIKSFIENTRTTPWVYKKDAWNYLASLRCDSYESYLSVLEGGNSWEGGLVKINRQLGEIDGFVLRHIHGDRELDDSIQLD